MNVRKYLALAIVPLALILWGLFGATQLTTASFTAFVNYQTPYTIKSAPGNADEAVTSQLIIIVADGLRLDASRQMKNLNALREKGADRVMRVGQPSLSLPGWTVIGTGAWQEQHGQTTNFNGRLTQMDSIFLAAKRKGLTTGLTGASSWKTLFDGHVDAMLVEPDPDDPHHHPDEVRKQDDAIEADALKILKEKNPNLLLIHFTAPDDAYHGFGVFSPEGQRAAQDVDARLGRLLQLIDLSKSTLFFTADHGHIDRGGHGGPEEVVLNVEFVAAGKGIKPGKYERATQADIAPTAAVLLGTSFPTDNQGDPLFDMLDMIIPAQAHRATDWAQEIIDRYTNIVKVIGVGAIEHPKLAQAKAALAADSYQAAMDAAQAEVRSTRDWVATARENHLQQERLARTPLSLVFLLPLALYIGLMRKMGWEFKRPLIGAAAYFIVYYALFFGRGEYFSLSVFNEDTNITPWFAARTIDAIIALAVSAAAIGILSRGDSKYQTALNMINAAFFASAVLWLQVDIFYWLYDFTWPLFLPDLAIGFKYYLDTLQTGAFMVKSPPIPTILLLPLIALGVKWAAEHVLIFKS